MGGGYHKFTSVSFLVTIKVGTGTHFLLTEGSSPDKTGTGEGALIFLGEILVKRGRILGKRSSNPYFYKVSEDEDAEANSDSMFLGLLCTERGCKLKL